jgi:hypothetical protein
MRSFIAVIATILPIALFTLACSGDPNGSIETKIEQDTLDASSPDAASDPAPAEESDETPSPVIPTDDAPPTRALTRSSTPAH